MVVVPNVFCGSLTSYLFFSLDCHMPNVEVGNNCVFNLMSNCDA